MWLKNLKLDTRNLNVLRLLSRWPILVLLVTLAVSHGVIYQWRVPLWQTPDEPTQFEYVALIGRHGGFLPFGYRDVQLEGYIADSLVRHWFFEYLGYQRPSPSPRDLDEVRATFFMPRQVGLDPPLYFTLAALPVAALDTWPIENQARLLRLAGVLLVAATVVCAYGAARELFPHERSFAFATGLLVALQPMFVFTGSAVSNDALANLIGAGLCWGVLRAMRCGMTRRRLATLLTLGALGVLTKRTVLPVLLALGLVSYVVLLVRLLRTQWHRRARIAAGSALLLLPAFGIGSLFLAGGDRHTAAEWAAGSDRKLAPRVAHAPGTGRAALMLLPGELATQPLLRVVQEWTEGYRLRAVARVWTAGETARGELAIECGKDKVGQLFEARVAAQEVTVEQPIPSGCPFVQIVLRSFEGTYYAAGIRATSDRQPTLNLLLNGDATQVGIHPDTLAMRLLSAINLREATWLWRSGRLIEPPPGGWMLPRMFFASFWGQFGWMSVPLVLRTRWELALQLVCLAGLGGLVVWLVSRRPDPWQRRATAMLVLICAVSVLLPILNAYIQPHDQAIVQGRYIFPALVPIVLLLVTGWRSMVPRRLHGAFLLTWTIWWGYFALSALQIIERAYHSS